MMKQKVNAKVNVDIAKV